MTKKNDEQWESVAYWPEGTVTTSEGKDITVDTHSTEGAAEGVCGRLEREGFGGQGKIFPLKTEFRRKQ